MGWAAGLTLWRKPTSDQRPALRLRLTGMIRNPEEPASHYSRTCGRLAPGMGVGYLETERQGIE